MQPLINMRGGGTWKLGATDVTWYDMAAIAGFARNFPSTRAATEDVASNVGHNERTLPWFH